MGSLLDSMDFVRRKLERADGEIEPRVPWNVTKGERLRRERVVARMRIDPAFADFTPEAQEKFVRAALTDNWDSVLTRLPRMGPEV
jgi:hypothetical protein